MLNIQLMTPAVINDCNRNYVNRKLLNSSTKLKALNKVKFQIYKTENLF